jgi:3-oxoadipate enol-lactonase
MQLFNLGKLFFSRLEAQYFSERRDSFRQLHPKMERSLTPPAQDGCGEILIVLVSLLICLGSSASRAQLPVVFAGLDVRRTTATKWRLNWVAEGRDRFGGLWRNRMAFAELKGNRIHYEFDGAPRRPVLVLSNSLGANVEMWRPQLAALSANFSALRYDTRGHGQSAAPRGPYSIAELAGDVLGLLDHLEISQASFCGISMGGLSGQWLAIYEPARISKLILASTAARIGTADGWQTRIAAVLADGMEPLIPGTLDRWLTAPFRAGHPEVADSIRTMLRAANPHGYVACCEAICDADFRDEVRAITTPTLVISAKEDPATPPADGQFLAREIPNAQYVELAAAHLSNLEAVEEFNAAAIDFLDQAGE